MRLSLTIAAAVMLVQPLAAHPGEAHAAKINAAQHAHHADETAVRAVLAQYQAAIERLDATGTEKLFAPDSAIFETGGVEGNYANYLEHHLTPELGEFKSFKFSNYRVDVRLEGPLALTTESYDYRIETKGGVVADRVGVTTSVLKKAGGQWKILVSHNSARKPQGS